VAITEARPEPGGVTPSQVSSSQATSVREPQAPEKMFRTVSWLLPQVVAE